MANWLKNKLPDRVVCGVLLTVGFSYAKTYLLMPYVYDAFFYELYHFSCVAIPVLLGMLSVCFVYYPDKCDISHNRKCNYPLFILAISAIVEALIFLAFLISPSSYDVIFAIHELIWQPLYTAVELAMAAWVIYNGNIFKHISNVCDRVWRGVYC